MSNYPKSIIIVDRSQTCGCRLRNSLLVTGATTHVFNSFAPALRLLQSKAIDTVVVEFATDQETLDFCDKVRALHIPVVYSTGAWQRAPKAARSSYEFAEQATL